MARRIADDLMAIGRSGPASSRLARSQVFRFKLVDVEQFITAGRLLVWQAASRSDAGLGFSREASIAKRYCAAAIRGFAADALGVARGTPLTNSLFEKTY